MKTLQDFDGNFGAYLNYRLHLAYQQGATDQMQLCNEEFSYSECGDKHFYVLFETLVNNPYSI